jgi:hypothetical protein
MGVCLGLLKSFILFGAGFMGFCSIVRNLEVASGQLIELSLLGCVIAKSYSFCCSKVRIE